MRRVTVKEARQRGCKECADSKKELMEARNQMYSLYLCKHEECPYHELDNIRVYEQYLHGQKKNRLFEKWLAD